MFSFLQSIFIFYRIVKNNIYVSEASKMQHNEDLDTPQMAKSLVVRIRVTTFTDGKKYFEILESAPSP